MSAQVSQEAAKKTLDPISHRGAELTEIGCFKAGKGGPPIRFDSEVERVVPNALKPPSARKIAAGAKSRVGVNTLHFNSDPRAARPCLGKRLRETSDLCASAPPRETD
jgi:hypothetical protein